MPSTCIGGSGSLLNERTSLSQFGNAGSGRFSVFLCDAVQAEPFERFRPMKSFDPATVDASELGKHIAKTYRYLRLFMVVIGVSLLAGLWLWSSVRYRTVEPGVSLSGYYHAKSSLVGDCFVGGLCGVGICLIAYHGFSTGEDWWLNAAGVCVIGVALFPASGLQAPRFSLEAEYAGLATAKPEKFDAMLATAELDETEKAFVRSCHEERLAGVEFDLGILKIHPSLHGAFAIGFFVCLAIVAIFYSDCTLQFIDDQVRRKRLARMYRRLGMLMIVLPIVIWVLLEALEESYMVFAVEVVGVVVFAAYWLLKTFEFKGTDGTPEAVLLGTQVSQTPRDD